MCGILGVCGKLPEQKKVETARDTMSYRGPDDFGIYYNQEEGIALGHRRLSIIDLSPAGHQPFFSHDGRFILIFNGEIYNYQEIRKELKDFYPFKSHSDSEVLLAAFMKWGSECMHKFNGMFAFAIWDKEKRTLFIARDRLGVKPLYYYVDREGTFYFSSEIKGILAFDDVPRKLNFQGFLDYLSYRYPLGEQTMFEGIYSLLAGHYLRIDANQKITRAEYWQLPISAKKDPGEEEALKKTEKLLEEAVAYRMISDVPVGAFLSGGLDSSLLVALMAKFSREPIRTFSIGFAEDGYSELDFAQQVADLFKTDHHEYLMSGSEYFDLFTTVIRHKDAPLATQNEAALYFLSKKVKEDATVLLGGDGADELFAGYGRIFRSADDWGKIQQFDEMKMSDQNKAILKANLIKKYGDVTPKSAFDHFLGQYSYFDVKEKSELVNSELFKACGGDLLNREFFASYFSNLENLAPIDQFLYVFQIVHLLGPLQRLDVPTMAASVEARVPYVDYRLIEYVSSLPHCYKLAWKSAEDQKKAAVLNSDQASEIHDIPKYLLRKIAEKYLPAEIIERKKMGFPAPLDKWFHGDFHARVCEMLLGENSRSAVLYNREVLENWLNNAPAKASSRKGMNIWMLLNMEIWMREYGVGIS